MSKPEVCKYLGKSKRTIETYVSSGRLPATYFNGPNGQTAMFERADVEAVKEEKSKLWRATLKPAEPAEPKGLSLVPAAVTALTPLAERLIEALTTRHALPVYVSLKDACALTGLSAATIKAAGVKTMPFGAGVRYRRCELEAL
jgi:excisionase family DNA binding protein